jgi:hypothetical protein
VREARQKDSDLTEKRQTDKVCQQKADCEYCHCVAADSVTLCRPVDKDRGELEVGQGQSDRKGHGEWHIQQER